MLCVIGTLIGRYVCWSVKFTPFVSPVGVFSLHVLSLCCVSTQEGGVVSVIYRSTSCSILKDKSVLLRILFEKER